MAGKIKINLVFDHDFLRMDILVAGVAAMLDLIRRFVAERRGGIAVEYALAVGLVGAVIALALAGLGDALDQSYEPVMVVTSHGYELSNQRGF
jgi:Flp pilus assembly pilin Flp